MRWMSHNPQDAEDALSSAMLQAEQKYARFADSINNPRSWLTRLVHNVCMDHHRSRSRIDFMDSIKQEEQFSYQPHATQQRTPATPDEQALNQEHMDLLSIAIDQLSPRLRKPLVMRCLQDLSYGEIASILGITEAAVRKRVQLAREKLRSQVRAF